MNEKNFLEKKKISEIEHYAIGNFSMEPYRKLFKEWKDRGINDHYPKDIIKKDACK